MLTKRQKENVFKDYGVHEGDTGSAEVQVALFTKEIDSLTKHLKTNPKDNSSRRGLLRMVSKRKKFLVHLEETNKRSYNKVTKKLGLKK
ncbi:MAG: 30S ribosomal protein S15 [Patescibacteria group bacterium]|nr:30S ribosomal protein S15 [Patescibacteria group bacterium]MDE2438528.1 30S ribosomal protein S15 [Patescibacteria group bacterium]